MSPVGDGVVSLTKFYRLRDLVGELARVVPGMTAERVRDVLGAGQHSHRELADDLLLYESGGVVDDPLLQACRSQSESAPALVWVALVMADHRVAKIVETYLTGPNGKLVEDHFNTGKLETALKGVVGEDRGTRKSATNILSYLRDSRLVLPTTHGKTVVGIGHTYATAPFVRDATRYILFRLQHFQLPHPVDRDDPSVAIAIKANHWLNLTPEEWRAAYDGTSPDIFAEPPPPEPSLGDAPPIASEVEVEAQNTESYEVSGQTTRTAVRREQTLVIAYKQWMEDPVRGSHIVRFRIRPPDTPAHLFNDIYDKTRNNLIEGKADASRPSIRMAIGQLMDYRRFAPAGVRLAVLTKRRPHSDLEALLKYVGIGCIWKTDDGFEDNADGGFV
jgi:hypothetical protein